MRIVALALLLGLSGPGLAHDTGKPHDHDLLVAETQEMVCFELPKPDCGCGLAKLVDEETPVVCVPAKTDKQ